MQYWLYVWIMAKADPTVVLILTDRVRQTRQPMSFEKWGMMGYVVRT